MSTMWSTCSMSTGHCSTHAPQGVHDHSASAAMTALSSGLPTRGRSASPIGGARGAAHFAALLRGPLLVALVILAAARQQIRGLGVRVVAQREHDQLRR